VIAFRVQNHHFSYFHAHSFLYCDQKCVFLGGTSQDCCFPCFRLSFCFLWMFQEFVVSLLSCLDHKNSFEASVHFGRRYQCLSCQFCLSLLAEKNITTSETFSFLEDRLSFFVSWEFECPFVFMTLVSLPYHLYRNLIHPLPSLILCLSCLLTSRSSSERIREEGKWRWLHDDESVGCVVFEANLITHLGRQVFFCP
jgi:hypothetical protein